MGTTCLILSAGSLASVPQSAGAVPPTKSVAEAAALSPAGLGAADLQGMLSPFATALGRGRWLASSMTTAMASLLPGQELIVAPELPVRFVPGTTETTPVTVKNTTDQTLPASLKLSYWWAEVGAGTPINGHNAAEVPLGVDLAPGAEIKLFLDVRTPIQSDNGAKRLDYDLYVDLKDGTGWWSATHSYGASSDRPSQLCGLVAGRGLLCPDRLVEAPTSNQLGLEKFLSYSGEETGAGTSLASNLSSGNAVWSYAPIQNPSIGPSTFVRLTYNSMDVSDPGTGYGWSVQASTPTRLGSVLSVPKGNAVAKTMTFVDGDGTTHEYKDGVRTGSLTTYKRPAGVHLDLTRDESQPVEKQWVFTRPDGVRFYYNHSTGLPTSVVDTHNNTLTFTHDSDGQLTKLVDARGRTTLTLGWANKHLVWMQDISGRGIKLTHNGTGQLTSLKDGAGFNSATGTFTGLVKNFGFTYTTEPVNKNAKLLSVTDPRGNTTDVTYFEATEDSKHTWWVKKLTDRRDHDTTFAYSDPDGTDGEDAAAVVTDVNGSTPSVTSYRVDGFGRTESILDAKAFVEDPTKPTTLLWDEDHNVIKMTDPRGSVSSSEFDDITGYPTLQKDAEAFAAGTAGITMVYEQLTGAPGRPTVMKSITKPPGQDAPQGRTSTFAYNATTGDLLSVTDPLGHATTYTYNADGTLKTETDARGVGHTTTYPASYDAAGSPSTITDALGKVTTFVYDARGNVTQVTNAANEVTTVTYDGFGRPTTQTTPHEVGSTRTTTTDFDLNDNIVSMTSPTGAVSTTTYTPMDQRATDTLPANSEPTAARVATYAYDDLDRVNSMTSPAGRATTYGYDLVGQTTSVTAFGLDIDGQAQQLTTRYTYDLAGNTTKVEKPVKVQSANPDDFSAKYVYDRNNRVRQQIDADGNISKTDYDTDGTVSQSTDATGVVTTYDYDLDGRTKAVTVPHGGSPRTTTYAYDVVNNQTRVTTPSGRYSETDYDKLNRPVQTRSPFDSAGGRYGQPTRTFVEYDEVGRVWRQSDPTWSTTAQDWTTYTFHPSGDIKSSTDPWNQVVTYGYDKNGQQTLRTAKSTDNKADRTMTWAYYPDGSLKLRTDGATASTQQVVVDNPAGSAGSGTWNTLSDARTGKVGADYRVENYVPPSSPKCIGTSCTWGPGPGSFSWPISVSTSGDYTIAVTCPRSSTTDEAGYTLSGSGASASSLISQNQCASGYTDIMTAQLNAGSTYALTVRGVSQSGYSTPPPVDRSTSRVSGDGSKAAGTTSIVPTNQPSPVTTVADAVRLTLPSTDAGRSYTYAYDKDGVATLTKSQAQGETDKKWVSTPDGLGRVSTVEEFHGVESIARRKTDYRFDNAGRIRTMVADGKGTVDNQATSRFTRYDYDSREMVQVVESGKGSADPDMKSTTYTYNARGQRATVTKGNGNVVTRTYFESGQTKKTEEMDGTRLVARHELTYTLEGDRKTDTSTVSHGEGGADLKQLATYAYTPARQLESVSKVDPTTGSQSGTTGKNEAYLYDAAGNTTCQTIGATTTVLKYLRNRLDQTWPAVSSCAVSTPVTRIKHDYDMWGRASVVKFAATSAPIKEYEYDGFDRIISDTSYKADGTNDTTNTTTYDAFDRTMSRSSKIGYNAARTTRFVYLGLSDQVANEEQKNTSGAWAITKSYSYGPGGEQLSMVDSPLNGTDPAQTFYYGTNPHGDVETLTDKDGSTKATYRYEAFGALDPSGTTGLDKVMNDPVQDADLMNPYRFNSMRVDGATGQYDMGFRTYDPGLNRFLTRDSYNGALDDVSLGLDPWTVNRYAFAGGNPVTFSELDGHRPIEENGDEVENPSPYYPPTDDSSSSSSSSNSGGTSGGGGRGSRKPLGSGPVGFSDFASLMQGVALAMGNVHLTTAAQIFMSTRNADPVHVQRAKINSNLKHGRALLRWSKWLGPIGAGATYLEQWEQGKANGVDKEGRVANGTAVVGAGAVGSILVVGGAALAGVTCAASVVCGVVAIGGSVIASKAAESQIDKNPDWWRSFKQGVKETVAMEDLDHSDSSLMAPGPLGSFPGEPSYTDQLYGNTA